MSELDARTLEERLMCKLAVVVRRLGSRVLNVAADLVIIGGVLMAPVGGTVAIIGLMLPGDAPLHHVSALIFGVVALWFLLALISAHLRRRGHNMDGPIH